MQEKNTWNKLKIACGLIYAAVVLAILASIYVAVCTGDSNSSNFRNSVSIRGNNNTVFYNVTPEENLYSKLDSYADRILCVKKPYTTKEEFSFWDARELAQKIQYWADTFGLSDETAFIIVHTESDFCNVRNGYGATGLCQVTKGCLDEYNTYSGRHKYTMQDMFDLDKNLEVGFWYYSRLLKHYKHNGYPILNLRDAYIAYNIGVTLFNDLSWEDRQMIRKGTFPVNRYGLKRGDTYYPVRRYDDIAAYWAA